MTKTNNDLLPLLVPISSIHEDPDNARTHDERNLAAITASLSEFGQQKPIVVDSNHCVIAGNGTLAAAKILGWSQIAVTRTSLSDENARRAYALADNKTAELASWDLSILSETLSSLSQFDNLITATGFDEKEIESLINLGASKEETAEESSDEEKERGPSLTEPGDLWILGNHRLLCADSSDIASVEKILDGQFADLILTDPPYNVGEEAECMAAPNRKSHKALKDSSWDRGFSFDDFHDTFARAASKNASIYVFTSWSLFGSIYEWVQDNYEKVSACVWSKPNPMPSLMKRNWVSGCELVVFGANGKHTFNYPEQGNAHNVWSFAAKGDPIHPTSKPVPLLEHILTHSSNVGDLVFDPFGGSGSTLIACELLQRRARLIELDPGYCDRIVERWEIETGQKATRQKK